MLQLLWPALRVKEGLRHGSLVHYCSNGAILNTVCTIMSNGRNKSWKISLLKLPCTFSPPLEPYKALVPAEWDSEVVRFKNQWLVCWLMTCWQWWLSTRSSAWLGRWIPGWSTWTLPHSSAAWQTRRCYWCLLPPSWRDGSFSSLMNWGITHSPIRYYLHNTSRKHTTVNKTVINARKCAD